jgi:gas vesicle protein
MNELIIALVGVISSGATGYLSFLFARSKYKQEVEKIKVEVLQARESADTIAIDNDIKLSGHYKEILDDLKGRYENRYKEFEEMMNRKFLLLEDELKLKDKKIKLQQQEITELKRENRTLRTYANNNLK